MLLGFRVLWHCVGQLFYVFLVHLVLVLFWNKFSAFYSSFISLWIWLIWTVKDLVLYWYLFRWRERYWSLDGFLVSWNSKMDYGRGLQMWSLVSSNRRQPHSSLVGFGYGVHQRVIWHRSLFGLGYGAKKRVFGHMVLL